jgi:hypothetical protein
MAEMLVKDSVVETPRPDAPYHLSDDEAEEWRAIVASMPPDHFARCHYSMLEQLCRHNVAARMIGALIVALRKQKKISNEQLTHLLSLQDRETKTIVYLMQSMRLTQQSVYRADSSKLRPLKARAGDDAMINPWEDDE